MKSRGIRRTHDEIATWSIDVSRGTNVYVKASRERQTAEVATFPTDVLWTPEYLRKTALLFEEIADWLDVPHASAEPPATGNTISGESES